MTTALKQVLGAALLACLYSSTFPSSVAAEFACVEGIDFENSPIDSGHVIRLSSAPGATCNALIYLKSDSISLGAAFVVRYPSQLLTPILLQGAFPREWIEVFAVGRAGPENPLGYDITPRMFGTSYKVTDSAIIIINWLPSPNISDSVPGGAGAIISIPFTVNPSASVGDSAAIFLDHYPLVATSVEPPVQVSCILTSLAQIWESRFEALIISSVLTLNHDLSESTFLVGCCANPGDFDNDGSFNIADVTAGIAHIFTGGPRPDCVDQADFNGDNNYNISDVTAGIASIFSGGLRPACGSTGQ